MSKVFVIILNFNHLEDLIETIESFLCQDYVLLNLIVVDNNSTDTSISYLKKFYPQVHVIQNEKNLGWSGGNNVGINYAINNKADYILLANNDLSFNVKTLINDLVKHLENNPQLGIVGPQENDYVNKFLCANQGWIIFPKSKYKFNVLRKEQNRISKNLKLVDNVSGSFMLVKSSLFKELGLIDENLFLYAEDADFSLRAWEKGYLSAIDTNLIIYHKGSASTGNNSPLKIYYKTRNLIYLIRKHKALQENHYYFLGKYFFDNSKLILKILIQNEYANKRAKLLKAQILGLYHGLILKRFGQYY